MPQTLAAGPVRTALYSRLSATGAVSYGGSAVAVYDDMAPQGTTGRWVSIDSVLDLDDSTKNSKGREVLVTVGIWSPYQGTVEVDAIAQAIATLLTTTPLTVSGFSVTIVGQGPESCEIDIDDTEEPVYRHGIQQWRWRLFQL